MRWSVLVVGWAGCIGLIVGMLAIELAAERVTLLAVANFVPPLAWLVPVGGLAAVSLIFSRWGLVPVVVTTCWWVWGFSGLELRESPMNPEEDLLPALDASLLRVLTCNRGQSQGHSLQPFLQQVLPDLVALQDQRGKGSYYRRTEAYSAYKHVGEVDEFLLLSRFPILSSKSIRGLSQPDRPSSDRPVIGARFEVAFRGQSVAIYSIHLPSPRRYLGSLGLRSIAAEGMDLIAGDGEVNNPYWRWRVQMAEALSAALASETEPWLLVGDVNSPPRGLVYKALANEGTDLHPECGSGFGFTFPGSTRNPLALGSPWMRLDYVFAQPSVWQGKWVVVEDAGKSQHRAVAAEVRFVGPGFVD